ncbi:MAG: hypothetical protein JXB00_06820 [Bacteroidales bacterium]|nr:hypothetical protein [Bacteroidales bacterium]
MPSLSPGVAGAKEAYGVSILRENNTIKIPPKAFARYNLKENGPVLLTSTRAGERGFAVLNIEKAKKSVFKKIIDSIKTFNEPVWVNSRPYAITEVINETITFNNALLKAFDLKEGERFIVIKSTTVAMSFNPTEVFKAKLQSHGFFDAVKNIDKLEIFE